MTIARGRGKNWGGRGRWDFVELTDPWGAEHVIRAKYIQPRATAAEATA